jgi:2,4-diaminopentanoate dehydrogenase
MKDVRPIRVVHYGLGATGRAIAQMVCQTPGLELVGGIERDPSLLQRDLGEVLELDHSLGIPVKEDPVEVLESTRPDIAIVATTSLLTDTYPQIQTCLRARTNVISTCEELVYPYARHLQLAKDLDELACYSGVSVLGVGVNPGFVMDLLPLILTGPSSCVSRISVTRVTNATLRRASLYHRIGAGLTTEQFREHITDPCNRHIGMLESLHMIADAIGWKIERIDERIEPILSEEWVRESHFAIAPGQIAGIRQVAVGTVEEREAIRLDWQTVVGSQETYDAIKIEGTPPINLLVKGGLHGDHAASAIVLHAIRPVVAARCGLLTVTEMPPIRYTAPSV